MLSVDVSADAAVTDRFLSSCNELRQLSYFLVAKGLPKIKGGRG